MSSYESKTFCLNLLYILEGTSILLLYFSLLIHLPECVCGNSSDYIFPSPAEDKKANSSVRFHSFSRKESIPEDELVLRERSFDYKHRYCGHCNTTTDIKEANFFGR